MKAIEHYISKHHLFGHQSRIIVAVSGGADSVVLLHILLQLDYDCEVAHCNFHLRGEESERDEAFVRQLCATWNVPLHIKHFDTYQYADEHGISIEMAARDLRYTWFEDLRQAIKADVIAVAHHQNDQAETLLLNLQRGTGLRGLEGMHPKNGTIVRPLLCVSRTFIEDYCTLHHLDYVTDSSNSDITFQRNALRQQLISYTPAQITHIAETAEYMQGYEQLIETYIAEQREKLAHETPDGIEIDIRILHTYPAIEVLLYELLRPYGFKQIKQIYAALKGESGRIFNSNTHTIEIGREYLYIFPIKRKADSVPIIKTESISMPFTYPAADAWEAVLDASVMHKRLTLRHWQEGDWFIPLGMRGKKKLQDFFTDMKLSCHAKDNIWLLCADEDIAWIVGYRIDERYKVKQKDNAIHIIIEK